MPPRAPQRRSLVPFIVCGILILLILAAGAYFLVSNFFRDDAVLEDPKELIGDVGLLMLLPSDEQPTVATVTNLDALRDQPFFRDAKIGDVVLMYPKSGRAILYSPSENMIIEVAPIVIDAE